MISQMTATKLPSPSRLRLVVVMHRETIGQRISDQRKRLNLSQEALAERIGVRAQTVSRWERGANLGRISNLDRVAEALEITVGDLMADLDTNTNGKGPLDELKPSDPEILQRLSEQVAELGVDVAALSTQVQELLRRTPGQSAEGDER